MQSHAIATLCVGLLVALSLPSSVWSARGVARSITPVDFTDLPESEYVEVNLINPMPIGAKLKNPCKYRDSQKGKELVECDIIFWTEAAKYELRGLDMINKESGKILRTTKYENPYDPNSGAWHEANNRKFFLADGERSDYAEAARGFQTSASVGSWTPADAIKYVQCQAYAKLHEEQVCIRENFLHVCSTSSGSLPDIQSNCTRHVMSLHKMFAGDHLDTPSSYTSAITAAVISSPGEEFTEFDLILFDDTGRMSVSQWEHTHTDNSIKFKNPETGKKVKIFQLESIPNAMVLRNEAKRDDPKAKLDKWVANSYLMDQQLNNVRKFTTVNFGQKVRRSHIQAIALNLQSLTNLSRSPDDILAFPDGALCFASGYTGFMSEHYTSCKMPRSEIKGLRSVHALNLDITSNGAGARHLVYSTDDEKINYQRCLKKKGQKEWSDCTYATLSTPPNDIVTFNDGTCEKTIVFYDWFYTVHEPGSDLYNANRNLKPGFLKDQLPFYIMGAMAVNTTFYFFTRANVMFVYNGAMMNNCTALSFTPIRAYYAEDLIVPNNFKSKANLGPMPEKEINDYRPRLIEYREYARNASDAIPSFALEASSLGAISSKPTVSSGTNLAAIIIALLLGLIILAGIIYIYCLRSSVDDDLRVTGRKSQVKSGKRGQQKESLHMPTVRSGMDKQSSNVQPVKSTQSTKKTTRSPIDSHKSKKSVASTKSVKSSKSTAAKSASRGSPKSPRSPGAAAKSLLKSVKAK